MAADWSALTSYLLGKPETVTVSWQELENVVGSMPASAIDHSAWWSGDRTHIRAWKAAGFEVLRKAPGVSVTFRRVAAAPSRPAVLPPANHPQSEALVRPASSNERVVLVACAKSKLSAPAPAKDLYRSPRFRKARAYAERLGDPWFILSAEHGLVAPDEWLAPYERYLPDTSREYRRAWGDWVVVRLDLLLGGLAETVVELHAGESYVQPIIAGLERLGAVVERPLQGLTSGRWQGWYDAHNSVGSPVEAPGDPLFSGDPAQVIATLADATKSYSPRELAALERLELDGSGLYSWFVDDDGAEALTKGLGHLVEPGLVYIGQTGATRWPSGLPSDATLLSRIKSQHLRGRRSGSTLRRTFGSVLDVAFARPVLREELSQWMADRLRVVPLLIEDADSLGDLERRVVQSLEPPLNLDHVGLTPVRSALKRLRKESDERQTD